ncbi:hypothetical protein CXK93_07090 [Stutzerimonas decontaminans]|uniref:Uncharacterized protein n=1 Tax=Stutzerimonas decontaminans TaxID=3022791 RepID=A0ABX4W2B4_9GAMM|nr:hypothetical protein CXK93_07090 [Stutzerimonas decontaminans]
MPRCDRDEYLLGYSRLLRAYWCAFWTWLISVRERPDGFGNSLEVDGEIALFVVIIRYIYVFVLFKSLPKEDLHILQQIDAIGIDIGVRMSQAGFK